jgi:hypothetical protein
VSNLTRPCETCGGSGRIKREPRKNAAGEVDVLDTLGRFEALCDCCNGSGEVRLDLKAIAEQPTSQGTAATEE